MMECEIPVAVIWKLQCKLRLAVESERWDECPPLVKDVLAQLRLAVDKGAALTGVVHLDGVYTIGTMQYSQAPPSAMKALNRMNRIVTAAKRSLRK